MKKVSMNHYLMFSFYILLLFGCKGNQQDITGVEQCVEAHIYQIPGCGSFFKTAKKCFNYSFDEKLIINFCLDSNCCPDSNRFLLNADIFADTIFVSAIDTAEHLCLCICSYQIESKISGLTQDRYRFFCQYLDSVYYDEVIYRTEEYRLD